MFKWICLATLTTLTFAKHNKTKKTPPPTLSPSESPPPEVTKQCWGPDYPDPIDLPSQITLDQNLCLLAQLEPLTESQNHFKVELTYGDESRGAVYFSEWDPDSTEKVVCQDMDTCTVCLGFTDAFIDIDWASVSPKFITTCPSSPHDTVTHVTYVDTMFIGTDTDWIPGIVSGTTDFALRILKTNALTNSSVSDLFVSPFAITNALMFPLMAAGGDTQLQIINALGLYDTIQDIRKAIKDGSARGEGNVNAQLYSSYATLIQAMIHDDVDVHTAVYNRLWLTNPWIPELNPQVLNDFKRYGDIQGMNFHNDSKEATKEVDTYIQSKSHGMIQDPLDGKRFSQTTVLIFTNVEYWSMKWGIVFDEITNETFHDDVDGKGHMVTIMSAHNASVGYFATQTETQRDTHAHVHKDKADEHVKNGNDRNDEEDAGIDIENDVEVVIVPFKQALSSFQLVLVRHTQEKYIRDGPTSTIDLEKVIDAPTLKKWVKSARPKTMDIHLPHLNVYNRETITDALISLNVSDLYDPHKCDLRNLTKKKYQVYEDEMDRHEAFHLTQKGIEIGTLVSDGNGPAHSDHGPVKHADRPFLFFVMDSRLEMILFAGRVTNPNGWCVHDCGNGGGDHDESAKVWTIILVVLIVIAMAYFIIRWVYNVQVRHLEGADSVPHVNMCRGMVNCIVDQYDSLVSSRRGRERIPSETYLNDDIEDDHDQNKSDLRYQPLEDNRRDDAVL